MTDGDWRENGFRERPPTEATLAWVAAASGVGGRVVGCRRLTGGVSSAVSLLTVERDGRRTQVVLRQYPAGLDLQPTLRREIANLELVAGSGLPVPRVLSADVAGAATDGAPSLLTTRLPGRLQLDPPDPGPWLARIAELAARLHALDLPAPTFRPGTDSWIAPLDELEVPAGARRPEVWTAAFQVLATPPPADPAVFVHGDFLPVNLLWSAGQICGLTDGNRSYRGSRAIDVGQCRRYLASLYAPAWADELAARYRSITGVTLHPWWDLFALRHHDDSAGTWITRQGAGRRPVDTSQMTARVEVVVEAVLRRLG